MKAIALIPVDARLFVDRERAQTLVGLRDGSRTESAIDQSFRAFCQANYIRKQPGGLYSVRALLKAAEPQ